MRKVAETAPEPVWILAQSDGKYSFSGTLEANQTRSVEAASGIVAGEAKLAVHLTGGPLAGDDGTLTIWCVAGGLAPPGKSEGISLVLGQGGEFTESGFGPNFFKAAP